MALVYSSSRRRKSQRGGGIIETALVILTLLSMIIFIMDMGRILLMQQYVTERARATARSAAVNDWNATAVKNFLVYNSSTAPAGGGPGYLGLLTSQVTFSTLGSAAGGDSRVQVTVSGVPALTWIPYISGQYSLPPIVATAVSQSLGATN